MVWRFLHKFLLNDKLIDRLAESYPIRRAAQWVVHFFHKSKAVGQSQDIISSRSYLAQKAFNKVSEKLEEKLKSIAENLEKKSKKF